MLAIKLVKNKMSSLEQVRDDEGMGIGNSIGKIERVE